MRKFYTWVVNNPKKIMVLFFILTIAGAICQNMVKVNYDMTDYLPDDSPSTIALEVMEEEFDGGIPNARVMVKNVSIAEALEYKEQLENCEGVEAVLWLDDSISIYEPLELADTEIVETYYKDGNALFTVTVDESDRVDTVDRIRAIIGNDNAMSGDAVSTAIATTGTVNEITMITIFAIVAVLAILLITTTSWAEPLVVLVGLGVAIMINNGTNLIFGEISFVTNAAGSVLQLAVSLDYSVFLLHRYEECLKQNPDRKNAMTDALCKSTSSIASSGFTTVIGLVEKIRDTVEEYYPGTYKLAGEGISTYDLMDTITEDTLKVNLIAIAAVFIVLLLSMKSISLPVVLVFAIEVAIWINMGIPYFMDSVVHYIAYLIVSSVQLGATVDYAILFTDRYKENRETMPKKAAIIETISTVTSSILTSGTVLAIVGFLLYRISTHGILSQLGLFIGRGTLLSLTSVFFVLPGLLYLFDGMIEHTTLKLKFYNPRKEKKDHETF